MKQAADILAMDDRPEFRVEVPEWGLVGEDAAVCRQLDIETLAKIELSCDQSAEGRAKRSARLIIEGCISPKFGPEHEEALAKTKNPIAIGRLVFGILNGAALPAALDAQKKMT